MTANMIRYIVEANPETRSLGIRLFGTSQITYVPLALWGEVAELVGEGAAYSEIMSCEGMGPFSRIYDDLTGGRLTQCRLLSHLQGIDSDRLEIKDHDGHLFRNLIATLPVEDLLEPNFHASPEMT